MKNRLTVSTQRVLKMVLLMSGLMGLSGCDDVMKEKEMAVNSQVVTVNVEKVFGESAVAEKGRQHLKAVGEQLQKGADEIESVYGEEGSHPSVTARKEGLQRLELQSRLEEQAVNAEVSRVLAKTAQAWAEAHPGTVVLPRSAALGADKSTDITQEIISGMEKEKVAFGSLPEVTVKKPEQEKGAEKTEKKGKR